FCPRCEGLKPSSLVYYNLYEILDYMEANNYMNKETMLQNFLKWEFELTKGIRLKLNIKYEDDYICIMVN
ncbi:hypothetical protein ACUODF_55400, partial [Escherichia coli]